MTGYWLLVGAKRNSRLQRDLIPDEGINGWVDEEDDCDAGILFFSDH